MSEEIYDDPDDSLNGTKLADMAALKQAQRLGIAPGTFIAATLSRPVTINPNRTKKTDEKETE